MSVFFGQKAQSAVEYLMTYGWMLLVVAVVGGAIFSMVGDQSIESVSGFDSSHVVISDFGMTASSLQMVVEGGSQSITLKEVIITDNGETVSIPLDNDVDLRTAKTLNMPHLKETEETNEIDVEFKYNAGSLENITTSGTITGRVELDNSLAAYWTLGENQANSTHVYDISSHDNHGEIAGAPEFIRDGELNQVLEFDGENDYIYYGTAQPFDRMSDEDWTVSAWFKGYEDINSEPDIFGKGRNRENSWGVSMHGSELYIEINGDDRTRDRARTGSGFFDRNEGWHHVAAVYKPSGEIELWVNGELAATEDYTGEGHFDSDSRDGVIGSRSGDSSRLFHGRISNTAIFDRALSPNEIQAMYRNPALIQ